MKLLNALSYPYQSAAPLVPPLLSLALVYLLVCLALALRAAARDSRESSAVALIAASAVFLSAVWLYASSGQFALFGLLLFGIGVALGAPSQAPTPRPPGGWWSGLLVIALSTAVKLVDLETFPEHLNAYSAETGLWGIYTLDGIWPKGMLRGKEYDLVNGGQSPLHLPLLWATVRMFGGTIYALRFAEVVASTVMLLVFWAWLRRRLRGGWGLVALASFAFSPWHLAQSRMGTFYSASVGLGLGLLWIADRLSADARMRSGWWVAFGACAGLIGYAYAPLKVLYLFYFLVTLGLAWSGWRAGLRGWWRGPTAGLVVLACLVAVQLGWPPRFDQMFRRDFGPLATDTSIWHKTTTDQVSAETQPSAVVAANLWRNLVEWWSRTWAERRILAWYAPALSIAVPSALFLLWFPSYRVPALYFLIGVLPPLIIFPVQRRTLVLWPLVYVAGVVAGRELLQICGRLVDRRWWRSATWALFVACALVAAVHGVKVYATTNSIVGVGTYFGPEYRLQMLAEAERMMPSCRVFLVNPTIEEKVVALVRLFEPSRRIGDRDRFGFLDYSGDGVAVPRDMPLCFFHLHRPDDDPAAADVIESLAQSFEGAMVLRRWAGDGSDTLHYSLLMVAGGEAGVRSREPEVGVRELGVGSRESGVRAHTSMEGRQEPGYCRAVESRLMSEAASE